MLGGRECDIIFHLLKGCVLGAGLCCDKKINTLVLFVLFYEDIHISHGGYKKLATHVMTKYLAGH